MSKSVEASTAIQAWHDVKSMSPQGPWKVKKWNRRSRSARNQAHSVVLLERHTPRALGSTKPGRARKRVRPTCPVDYLPNPPRRRYGKNAVLWLSVCTGAIVAALAVSSGLLQFTPTNILTLAEARAFSSPLAQAPDEAYQLQLGSYREEIGARYAWTAYQASLGETLERWQPQFERIENGESVSYRILAGTFPSLGEADDLCARLQERNIPCTIVKL